MEKKKFVRKQERFVLFLMLLLLFPLGALAQQKLIKGLQILTVISLFKEK